MKKEIITFKEQTINEIPSQDNPQTYGDKAIIVCIGKQFNSKVEHTEHYEYWDIYETGGNNIIKQAECYSFDNALKIAEVLST